MLGRMCFYKEGLIEEREEGKGNREGKEKGDERAGVIAVVVWAAVTAGREERHNDWFGLFFALKFG
jgi:hypothetical protein